MRGFAIWVLIAILGTIIIEPLVEVSNVLKEKIVLASALSNATLVARNRSLIYEKQRDLDAEIDFEVFKEYFADAFEDALDVTRQNLTGEQISFRSNSDKYNDFTVDFVHRIDTDSYSGRSVTLIEAKLTTEYSFKTKYLKYASNLGSVDYDLISEKLVITSIRN